MAGPLLDGAALQDCGTGPPLCSPKGLVTGQEFVCPTHQEAKETKTSQGRAKENRQLVLKNAELPSPAVLGEFLIGRIWVRAAGWVTGSQQRRAPGLCAQPKGTILHLDGGLSSWNLGPCPKAVLLEGSSLASAFLTSLISNCLNLPLEVAEVLKRLNKAYLLQTNAGTGKDLYSGGPHGVLLGFSPLLSLTLLCLEEHRYGTRQGIMFRMERLGINLAEELDLRETQFIWVLLPVALPPGAAPKPGGPGAEICGNHHKAPTPLPPAAFPAGPPGSSSLNTPRASRPSLGVGPSPPGLWSVLECTGI
nr:uncharacterized protein LOC116149003 [Camelus dromedarius]